MKGNALLIIIPVMLVLFDLGAKRPYSITSERLKNGFSIRIQNSTSASLRCYLTPTSSQDKKERVNVRPNKTSSVYFFYSIPQLFCEAP